MTYKIKKDGEIFKPPTTYKIKNDRDDGTAKTNTEWCGQSQTYKNLKLNLLVTVFTRNS